MKKKKEYVLIAAIFITFFVLSQFALVSAITGSMGNARMVLYPEVNGLTNTIIEKSILVKNVNEIPITVKLEVDPSSTDFLELVDEGFTLEPGTEERAEFKIKVKKPGRYDGKINVFFSEAGGDEKGPGVALASNIIIIANNPKDNTDEPEDPNTEEPNTNTEDLVTGDSILEQTKERNPVGILLIITTAILVVIALILLFIWSERKRKKKVESKPKKSNKSNEKPKTKKK
jgi:hypothetical protein